MVIRILNHGLLYVKPVLKIGLVNQLSNIVFVPIRTKYYNNRHRDPLYRRERTRKVWPIDLPDFDRLWKLERDGEKIDPDEARTRMKEKGIAPTDPWKEKLLYNSCSQLLIDPYEPASDEKSTSLVDKFKSPLSSGKSYIKDKREMRTLKTYEGEDFDLKSFSYQAVETYKKAHECLAARNEDEIFNYVTEYCLPFMNSGLKRTTIIWKYLDEIEQPRVVQVRGSDIEEKGNKFSQITVRMHTKQILAIYDRHGRLIYGSPSDVKEVLEYVVFEKYLVDEYGSWRVHGRVGRRESLSNTT